MSTKYIVQKLAGYTDGRESWQRVFVGWVWDRASAECGMIKLQRDDPNGKYRVRKVTRK